MFKVLTTAVQQHWHQIIFGLIVCLALVLRTYKLDSVPAGLTVDEASIGYNAYGLLTNHRDEWLVRTPLAFKAFGEFKPPVAMYTTMVSVAIFGLNHFAIRLPMAVAGVITTVASYWITRRIVPHQLTPYVVMLLVAASPINIHFSRMAFESSIGVAAVAVGLAFFLWAQAKPILSGLYVLSFVSFAAAMYSNHATKIVTPLLIAILILRFIKVWWQRPLGLLFGVIVFSLLCIPLFNQTVNGSGAERFFMVSAITTPTGLKPVSELIPLVAKNYAAHLTPDFLLFGQTDSYRHGNYIFGILSQIEFIFAIIALGMFIKTRQYTTYWWLLAMLGAAILPAAIGTTIPHPNRVHHLVPWIQILAGMGIWTITQQISKTWRKTWLGSLLGLGTLILIWQQATYYRVFSVVAARDFQYGYREAIEYTSTQEESVKEIFFTSYYDHPYIYLLLYKQMTPMTYHFGGLIKYRLMNIEWQALKGKRDILIVAAPEEIPVNIQPTHRIYFPDGSVAFVIIRL